MTFLSCSPLCLISPTPRTKNTRVTTLSSLPVLLCFLPHGVQGGESAKEGQDKTTVVTSSTAQKKDTFGSVLPSLTLFVL